MNGVITMSHLEHLIENTLFYISKYPEATTEDIQERIANDEHLRWLMGLNPRYVYEFCKYINKNYIKKVDCSQVRE